MVEAIHENQSNLPPAIFIGEDGQEITGGLLAHFNMTASTFQPLYSPSYISPYQQGQMIDQAVQVFDDAYVDYLDSGDYKALFATYDAQKNTLSSAHASTQDMETMEKGYENSVRPYLEDVLSNPNVQEAVLVDTQQMAQDFGTKIKEFNAQIQEVAGLSYYLSTLETIQAKDLSKETQANRAFLRELETELEIEQELHNLSQDLMMAKLDEIKPLYLEIKQYESMLGTHILTPEQENNFVRVGKKFIEERTKFLDQNSTEPRNPNNEDNSIGLKSGLNEITTGPKF